MLAQAPPTLSAATDLARLGEKTRCGSEGRAVFMVRYRKKMYVGVALGMSEEERTKSKQGDFGLWTSWRDEPDDIMVSSCSQGQNTFQLYVSAQAT